MATHEKIFAALSQPQPNWKPHLNSTELGLTWLSVCTTIPPPCTHQEISGLKKFIVQKHVRLTQGGRYMTPPQKIVGLKLCLVVISFAWWGCLQKFRPLVSVEWNYPFYITGSREPVQNSFLSKQSLDFLLKYLCALSGSPIFSISKQSLDLIINSLINR